MAITGLTPPMDNFYKFVAIVGLLIIGWTSGGFIYLDHRAIDKADQKLLLFSQFVMNIKYARGEEAIAKQLLPGPENDRIREQAEKDVKTALDAQVLEEDASRKELEARSDVDLLWTFTLLLIVVGVSLTVFGLIGWYRKVQKIEDQLKAQQVEKATLEVSNIREAGLKFALEKELLEAQIAKTKAETEQLINPASPRAWWEKLLG